MRTTLSMDEQLLREAKSRAAISGVTLSAFIEQSVREKLARFKEISDNDRRPLLVFHKTGGVMPGINLDKTSELLSQMDEWDAADRRERDNLRSP
jgi:hypothetical protein